MPSKLERLAGTIYHRMMGAAHSFANCDGPARELYLDIARALLQELREPDEGMLEAMSAKRTEYELETAPFETSRLMWQAAIDYLEGHCYSLADGLTRMGSP